MHFCSSLHVTTTLELFPTTTTRTHISLWAAGYSPQLKKRRYFHFSIVGRKTLIAKTDFIFFHMWHEKACCRTTGIHIYLEYNLPDSSSHRNKNSFSCFVRFLFNVDSSSFVRLEREFFSSSFRSRLSSDNQHERIIIAGPVEKIVFLLQRGNSFHFSTSLVRW